MLTLKSHHRIVLILVLVEHTLGETPLKRFGYWDGVLILVLVEHTLGAPAPEVASAPEGLNPCFSGTYSRSLMLDV